MLKAEHLAVEPLKRRDLVLDIFGEAAQSLTSVSRKLPSCFFAALKLLSRLVGQKPEVGLFAVGRSRDGIENRAQIRLIGPVEGLASARVLITQPTKLSQGGLLLGLSPGRLTPTTPEPVSSLAE
jgi:hypothetical protein